MFDPLNLKDLGPHPQCNISFIWGSFSTNVEKEKLKNCKEFVQEMLWPETFGTGLRTLENYVLLLLPRLILSLFISFVQGRQYQFSPAS